MQPLCFLYEFFEEDEAVGELGYPFCALGHIAIRHEVYGKQIARSYTPTSSNKDRGRLELTIKIYDGGKAYTVAE